MAKPKNILAPMKPDTSQSVRLEKIENGFLLHHETNGPKGYVTKKTFHPTAPKINIGVTPPKAPAKKAAKNNYPKF